MLHSKSNCFIQLKCLADVGVGRLKKQERQKVGKTKGSSLKSKPKMSLFSCFALVLILANYTHTTAAPSFLDILTRQYSCMLSNFFYFPSRFDYTSGSGLCSKQWLNQHCYKIKSGLPQIKKHEYILFCFFSWSFQPLRNCIHKIISHNSNSSEDFNIRWKNYWAIYAFKMGLKWLFQHFPTDPMFPGSVVVIAF